MHPVSFRNCNQAAPGSADNFGVIRSLRTALIRRRIQRLIRSGVGVHEASWKIQVAGDNQFRKAVVDDIARWVRESMGEMRRPYGIDHVALALACRDSAGRVRCSNSLGVIRPSAFYGVEGSCRIDAFFDDIESTRVDRPFEIVGALLSLGDLAYELDLARAA